MKDGAPFTAVRKPASQIAEHPFGIRHSEGMALHGGCFQMFCHIFRHPDQAPFQNIAQKGIASSGAFLNGDAFGIGKRFRLCLEIGQCNEILFHLPCKDDKRLMWAQVFLMARTS